MAKLYPSAKIDAVLHFVEGAVSVGLISGAAVAAAIGQLILGGILTLLAIGMFLRFKRGRVHK
ncbi:hypothetical protein FFI97_019615 [Variovorax sp. KBS0712]|nr:hypothetical protein FFI97_019615 [Variovorax sp. KBS0712]